MSAAYSPNTIVVTGATSGLGRAAAMALAARGIHVIGTGRSPEKMAELRSAILGANPGARFDGLIADFASLKEVRRLADEISELVKRESGGKLDCLMNIAGAFSGWQQTTAEGYEMQFAVNHLAPFLLTNLLKPLLCGDHASRVITMSSKSHYHAWMRWDDLMQSRRYIHLFAYMQSKLANVLFSYGLNDRFKSEGGFRAYAVSPRLVDTEIGSKSSMGLAGFVWKLRGRGGRTAEEGARTCIMLATESELACPDEVYWQDDAPCRHSRRSKDRADADRLWDISAKLVGWTQVSSLLGH